LIGFVRSECDQSAEKRVAGDIHNLNHSTSQSAQSVPKMAARRAVTAAEIASRLSTGDISETIAFSPSDFILYARSIGDEDVVQMGAKDLPFVFEEFDSAKEAVKGTEQRVKSFSLLPTFFTTPSFRTTWRKSSFNLPVLRQPPTLVHLSHRLIILGPLPQPIVAPTRPNNGAHPHPALNIYESTSKLLDVVERDGGKGLTTVNRVDTWEVIYGKRGRMVCSNYSTGMIGSSELVGVGRKVPPSGNVDPLSRISDPNLKDYMLLGIPAGMEPTHTVTFKTHPFQAALHRLVAHDDNPIHISPAGSIVAGFKAPILHGLATFGILGKMVTDACAQGDGGRLRSLNSRFAGVVIPGDTLLVRIWDPTVDPGKPKVKAPTAYKPGAKQYRRTVGDTGRTVKVVVFEAFVSEDGKERAVIKDGQAEFWEDGNGGARL